jgi:hypothetical protein
VARVSLTPLTVKRRKKKSATGASDRKASSASEERETVYVRGDRAPRQIEEAPDEQTSTSPALAGGDVDADWRRADSVGEEAPGGTVATPDQDSVDAAGDALGVPRAADEEFRPSTEILVGRDRYRREEEEG